VDEPGLLGRLGYCGLEQRGDRQGHRVASRATSAIASSCPSGS
jgi:hypothetical protein